MSLKFPQPYQPLLLRILHGLTGLFAIAAILTAFWTYNTYDGRWGKIPLPEFREIEGIHGTFGLWTLLVFPLFVIYAFNRGKQRLIQKDSFAQLTRFGQQIWWYNLHRLINTLTIFGVTFAVFSGKMMDEKRLPKGEVDHGWYYAHLISWLILVSCIALHLLMSIKVGGIPLILSMTHWRFHSKDSPTLWRKHFSDWRSNFSFRTIKQWLLSLDFLGFLEVFILTAIALAWIISLSKELT
ncbi:MAG: cytochrome b/b6 domain-containing protein [Spirulinaceae cyanobacterium]